MQYLVHLPKLLAAASVQCGGSVCNTGLPQINATHGQLQTLLQILFGVLAVVAVLMVTIGGFRYVMSEGNPEDTKKARATILYAIVGLVISISGEVIVSFVLNHL